MKAQNTTCITVCGAGWLGHPLSDRLVESGYSVKATTTTSEKLASLQESGVTPYLLSLEPNTTTTVPADIFNSDIVVITLPFKRSFTNPDDYSQQIQHLLNATPESAYIIFTSSTSVYSDTQDWVTESSPILNPSPRQKVLMSVENMILERNGTVLRLAGLYGPSRNIGGFMRHVKRAKSGKSPVNLVHLDDVIGVIMTLVATPHPTQTFNVVSDKHPTREELYCHQASKQGYPTPVFDNSQTPTYKVVSNQRLKDMLGYSFKYSDPMES
jgi:nucleoside-diphosphate-sugar epimerase